MKEADSNPGMQNVLQGCLAHKKRPSRRTLHKPYAWRPMVVLWGGGDSYERGSPVTRSPRLSNNTLNPLVSPEASFRAFCERSLYVKSQEPCEDFELPSIPQTWTFCTITFRWTNPYQQSGLERSPFESEGVCLTT